MEGTAGILVRAVALAAAFTSTSLRERWSEPGEEAAAGILEVWAGLDRAELLPTVLFADRGRLRLS